MSYISEVLADSPVAFWPLNDASGTAAVDVLTGFHEVFDGTYVGSPTLGVPGLVGTGSAVQTGASSNVVLSTRSDRVSFLVTIEFWFEYVSGSTPFFRDNRSAGGWYFDISGTNPVVSVAGITHTVSGVTSASLKDSARHHFVLTMDGGASNHLYLDGVEVDTWHTGIPSGGELASVFLLGKNGANANFSPTVFAAFALYATILPAARVAAHYAAADGHVAGVAEITTTARPVVLGFPGTAGVTVTALPVALSAPVETRAALRLVSSSITQVDAPPDAPDPRVVPIHIVSPSTPVPTLVNGVPQ